MKKTKKGKVSGFALMDMMIAIVTIAGMTAMGLLTIYISNL